MHGAPQVPAPAAAAAAAAAAGGGDGKQVQLQAASELQLPVLLKHAVHWCCAANVVLLDSTI